MRASSERFAEGVIARRPEAPRWGLRAFVAVVALFSLLACEQGAGDVCQIDDDCEEPLQCNAGTGRCQLGTGGAADAAVPFDAALPPDAARVDAAPLPDAAPVDAAPEIDAPL